MFIFIFRIAVAIMYFMHLAFCADKKIKQRLLAIEDCKLTDEKYDSENLVEHNFALFRDKNDKLMIKANFTIVKKTLPVYYTIRTYRLFNSSRKLEISIENITCKHPVIDAVLKKIKVKYNDDCSGNPGQYLVPKVNMDDLIKTYSHLIYGAATYIFEVQFTTRKGVIVCLSVTVALMKI